MTDNLIDGKFSLGIGCRGIKHKNIGAFEKEIFIWKNINVSCV